MGGAWGDVTPGIGGFVAGFGGRVVGKDGAFVVDWGGGATVLKVIGTG